jgi:hypothetical protein
MQQSRSKRVDSGEWSWGGHIPNRAMSKARIPIMRYPVGSGLGSSRSPRVCRSRRNRALRCIAVHGGWRWSVECPLAKNVKLQWKRLISNLLLLFPLLSNGSLTLTTSSSLRQSRNVGQAYVVMVSKQLCFRYFVSNGATRE